MKKNVTFITLGCKVNQAESESLDRQARTGMEIAAREQAPAEVCVINTCAVTGKAAMQSRQAIRRAVRNHPGATIIVTGCYAQIHPEEIRRINGVDYVVGQSDKHRILEIAGNGQAVKMPEARVFVDSIETKKPFERMPSPAVGRRTRPFLKIQDGCNSFCSYCIVPHSRGRSRSLPQDEVIAGIDTLVEAGAREIVLTGIHLGKWGSDLPGKNDLAGLLEKVISFPGLQRLRLSSLDPTEIPDRLLDLVQGSSKICRHFHIPLQSGDAAILKRMNRHYTPDCFIDVVNKIHARFDDVAIGADVMTGFPGETDQAFRNTRNLIDNLPVSYLHVFPFSPRPPAPAADYPEQVPHPVKKERALALSELGLSKKSCFYNKMTGRVLEVLTEKKTNKPGLSIKGLSSNYIPVYIQGNEQIEINRIVNCMITKSNQALSVTGVICENKP